MVVGQLPSAAGTADVVLTTRDEPDRPVRVGQIALWLSWDPAVQVKGVGVWKGK